MNFEIRTDPPGPLKILSNIPDHRLAVLEGLNGIGKTLAIRLLQLCTGTPPYRTTSEPWNSLCVGLGAFEITATDLKSNTTITWVGDSREWIDMPPQESAWSRIHVTINDQPSDIAAVRQFLTVERISGDEGILEMLALQIESNTAQFQRWNARYTGQDQGPLSRIESIADTAQSALGAPNASDFEQMQIAVERLHAEASGETERVDSLRDRRSQLTNVVQMRLRLSDAENNAPILDAEIASCESELATANQEREDIYRSVTQLAQETAFAEPQRRELRNARRALQRNREDLAYWLKWSVTSAADLRIEPEWPDLRAFESEVDQVISELRERQRALDAAPAMRQLLETTVSDFSEAEDAGLGLQVAIDDPEIDVRLTVSQARLGMSTRHTFLEGQPPPPEVLEVQEQLDEYQKMKQTCRSMNNSLSERDRNRRLVDKNEDRVNAALAMADPEAAEKLHRLEASLRETDDRIQALAAALAGLRHKRGMLVGESTDEALRAQFTAALQELGVEEQSLEGALSEVTSFYEVALARATVLTAQLGEAQRSIARGEADLRRAAGMIRTDEEFEWVRQALPDHLMPGANFSVQQLIICMDHIRDSLNRLVDRLANHRTDMGAVIAGMQSVSGHLQEQDLKDTRYDEAILEFFGSRFGSWFSDQSVREILLPESQGEISVDLRQLSVKWNEGAIVHTRPLEAFSSGEQAFAYTQARLAAVDQETARPTNRLIVLDEFGAFIAHDRLQKLIDYLRLRAQDHGEDQVLIVLPLSRDYASLAKEAISPIAETYESYAQEVKERGYALRVEVE